MDGETKVKVRTSKPRTAGVRRTDTFTVLLSQSFITCSFYAANMQTGGHMSYEEVSGSSSRRTKDINNNHINTVRTFNVPISIAYCTKSNL